MGNALWRWRLLSSTRSSREPAWLGSLGRGGSEVVRMATWRWAGTYSQMAGACDRGVSPCGSGSSRLVLADMEVTRRVCGSRRIDPEVRACRLP